MAALPVVKRRHDRRAAVERAGHRFDRGDLDARHVREQYASGERRVSHGWAPLSKMPPIVRRNARRGKRPAHRAQTCVVVITLSSVIGRSRTRTPVAWYTALASAAHTPVMPISPM